MARKSRTPLEHVRKYVWWTTVAAAIVVAFLAALALVGAGTAAEWAVLAPATAVVLVLYIRLTLSAMPGLGVPRSGRWAEVLVLVVGAGVWWYSAGTMLWVSLPAMAIAGVAAVWVGAARWSLVWGGTVALVGLGMAAQDWSGQEVAPDGWLFGMVVITSVFACSNVLQVWLWSMVVEIDRARQLAGELAVARERLRFAADLHDIQGHHLQAIALKAELAERLIGQDDDAARVNAAEAGGLARTALRETREVVRGYRRADLSTEIGNAVEVLRAAGIDARVDGDSAAVPPPLRTLFGALVREGTTNVLRHSKAATCTVTVRVEGARVRVTLANDGVDADREPRADGSGLDGLRERFATIGGAVHTSLDGGGFRLTGEAVAP
ncbi:sensor histidine kinase [Actinokineospora sp. 24-640]